MPVFQNSSKQPKGAPRNNANQTKESPTISALKEMRSTLQLPRRLVVYVIVRDESGSMRTWRQRQGEFLSEVRAHVIEVGGPRIGDLVYLLYVVVSGIASATGFTPLSQASDPPFTPDGQTPIGQALALVAAKLEAFFESAVFPQEATVKNLEFLIISDLHATGETADQTEAGVAAFVATLRKFRGAITLVGPDPSAMNEELARRLDVSGRGIKYLDADPKSIISITFDSLMGASRVISGGSNPNVGLK